MSWCQIVTVRYENETRSLSLSSFPLCEYRSYLARLKFHSHLRFLFSLTIDQIAFYTPLLGNFCFGIDLWVLFFYTSWCRLLFSPFEFLVPFLICSLVSSNKTNFKFSSSFCHFVPLRDILSDIVSLWGKWIHHLYRGVLYYLNSFNISCAKLLLWICPISQLKSWVWLWKPPSNGGVMQVFSHYSLVGLTSDGMSATVHSPNQKWRSYCRCPERCLMVLRMR